MGTAHTRGTPHSTRHVVTMSHDPPSGLCEFFHFQPYLSPLAPTLRQVYLGPPPLVEGRQMGAALMQGAPRNTMHIIVSDVEHPRRLYEYCPFPSLFLHPSWPAFAAFILGTSPSRKG